LIRIKIKIFEHIVWKEKLEARGFYVHETLPHILFFLLFSLISARYHWKKKRKTMETFQKIECPLEWAFHFEKTFHKCEGKNMFCIVPYRMQIHHKNPNKVLH